MSDGIIEKVEQIDCNRTFIWEVTLSDQYLQTLKSYATNALNEPHLYEDYGGKLAGHIKKGKQLRLPLDAVELRELVVAILRPQVRVTRLHQVAVLIVCLF